MVDRVLLEACSRDRALASQIIFTHRHQDASPDYHVQIIDLWRSSDELVLIEAFREGAKSTLAEEFLCLEGVFGNFHYALIIGETYSKACQRLEAIAYEGMTNAKLKSLFGGRVFSKKPTENKLTFTSGAFLEAIGWEQEMRSFKHFDHRPDRAYLDDVENLERVRDETIVTANVTKFYRELVPAMAKNFKIRFTQTPLANDCMVTRFRNSPGWVCRSFPICSGDIDDPKAIPAWPSRYPMPWIQARRDLFAENGQLRDFMQEYMLNVDTQASRPFSDDMVNPIDVAPAAWLPRIAIYDPSRTANVDTSDRTGKVVVSRLGSRLILHESGGFFWRPDDLRRDVFETADKHHCAEIGIEKNSLDEYLMQPLRFEMIRRGKTLVIRALQAPQDRDKEAFIMGLEPFFRARDILFVGGKGAHPALVAEMANFPSGKLDILNALAYALRMFAGQLVYEDFGEENVAPAHDPERGETVYAAWNANSIDTVCVALLRNGRHVSIAQDWAQSGPHTDAVRTIAAELRAAFPRNPIECYVPQQLHDDQRRIPLVAGLRDAKLTAFRGEHTAVSRGALAEKIRMKVRDRRLLCVDRRAIITLNALAGSYKHELKAGGKIAPEPIEGIHRLAAEAAETLTALLEKGILDAQPQGAHFAVNAQGSKYMTSLPQRR